MALGEVKYNTTQYITWCHSKGIAAKRVCTSEFISKPNAADKFRFDLKIRNLKSLRNPKRTPYEIQRNPSS